MNIHKLSDQDFGFLKEFVKVILSIADAITFVEGMKCVGSYLLTLFATRLELRKIYLA